MQHCTPVGFNGSTSQLRPAYQGCTQTGLAEHEGSAHVASTAHATAQQPSSTAKDRGQGTLM